MEALLPQAPTAAQAAQAVLSAAAPEAQTKRTRSITRAPMEVEVEVDLGPGLLEETDLRPEAALLAAAVEVAAA